MAAAAWLPEDDLPRVLGWAAAAYDLIGIEAAAAGRDESVASGLPERRAAFLAQIDLGVLRDYANRIGERDLRTLVADNAPAAVRDALDALIEGEGGMLPLVQGRFDRIESYSPLTYISDDAWGCGLGALAIVAGCVGNSVMGGVVVVVGIMAMASWCPGA